MITLSRLRVRNFKSLRNIDLSFPQQGSILVEGLNEAGKSTLFESVYMALYGEPLVAEETGARGRGRFDSAINYRAQEALIALTLDVDGTTVAVERTLRRGRSSDARLLITYPDTTDEEVSGVRAINDRLVQELGNLDKDTLLNSCFVEQKKLSKLEDLSSAARKESLEHLLNLDKLQTLQNEVRVTSQDKVAVQTAQQRLNLAETQSQIPIIERQISTLQRQLAAVALHTALDVITDLEQRQATLARQSQELDDRREMLQAIQERINAVKRTHNTLRDITTFRRELDQQEQQITNLSATIDRLEREERIELPALYARRAALDELYGALVRLQQQAQRLNESRAEHTTAQQQIEEIDRRASSVQDVAQSIASTTTELDQLGAMIEADEQRAQELIQVLTTRQQALDHMIGLIEQRDEIERLLATAVQSIEAAQAQVAEHAKLASDIAALETDEAQLQEALQSAEAECAAAEQVEAQVRELDALMQWLQGQHDIAGMSTGQVTRDELDQQVTDAATEHAHRQRAARTALILVIVFASVGIAGLGAGLALIVLVDPLWGGVLTGSGVLCLVLATLLGIRWRATNAVARAAHDQLSVVRQAQTELRAKQAALEAMGGGQARMTEAERLLQTIKVSVPGSAPDAEARIAALRSAAIPDAATASTLIEERRHARDSIRDRVREVVTRLSLLREQAQAHPGAQSEIIMQAQAESLPADLLEQQESVRGQLAEHAETYQMPVDRDALQGQLRTLGQELERERSILAAIPARRETLATRYKQLTMEQRALDEAQLWLAEHPRETAEQTLAEHEQAIVQQQHEYEQQQAEVERKAAELDVDPNSSAIDQTRGALGGQIRSLEKQVAIRPTQIRERDARTGQASQEQARLRVLWQEQLPLPENVAAPKAELPSIAELVVVENMLAMTLARLDESGVQQQLTKLATEQGGITMQQAAAQNAILQQQQQIAQLLTAQGVSAAPIRDAIAAVFPVLLEVARSDEEHLRTALDAARADLSATRRRGEELATQLNLQGVTLDIETEAAALDLRQHELHVKTRAEQIVKAVRERMVQKVLPNTERNMCLLLPLLTADRYRDCALTSDYKLQVWDEGAGRYVAKNIFSGGTRDQLSLALRLAFALATLPEELGTTPGFIFLDEPLSSFDGPRTEALIGLLTRGQIATNFSQIFVISHNRMFDRNAFTHHLVMDGGQVIEHDFDRSSTSIAASR